MAQDVTKRFHETWSSMISWASGYLNALNDEELMLPVAPGRNHGIWILGHLIESEDELSKYLGKGDMLYPEMEEQFGMKSKLLAPFDYPSAQELRERWKAVVAKNDRMFSSVVDEEWDDPHALVVGDPKEDFYGTKGRCIHLWILHQMYHTGQLAILLSSLGKSKY